MSVSRILRLGQKESRWTPQQESSGIRFYRPFNSLARYLVEDHVRIILLCKGKNFFYIISGLIICFHSSRRIIIDTIIILQAFTSKNALVKVQIIAKLFPCNQIAICSSPSVLCFYQLFCSHYTDLAGRYGCPSYTSHKKRTRHSHFECTVFLLSAFTAASFT